MFQCHNDLEAFLIINNNILKMFIPNVSCGHWVHKG
jgi:hypothetical protein